MDRNEFTGILQPIAELLRKKNTDYGSSYTELRDKYGPTGFHIFVENKLLRIKQVDRCGTLVNETAEDTIMDLIGYCTLELKYRRDKQGGNIGSLDMPSDEREGV